MRYPQLFNRKNARVWTQPVQAGEGTQRFEWGAHPPHARVAHARGKTVVAPTLDYPTGPALDASRDLPPGAGVSASDQFAARAPSRSCDP